MAIHIRFSIDYTKVWRIFWSRAKRQWDEMARDKVTDYELRHISQAGEQDTHHMGRRINRQPAQIGAPSLQ